LVDSIAAAYGVILERILSEGKCDWTDKMHLQANNLYNLLWYFATGERKFGSRY
jgi:hypothetical protein